MSEETNTSRLPAGSTLLVGGVHVAHPHAEVNLPGAGDGRTGETAAVTEEVKAGRDEEGNVTHTVEQRPLDEEVKPKTLTTDDGGVVKQVIEGTNEQPATSTEESPEESGSNLS